jgi:hypothetical protein
VRFARANRHPAPTSGPHRHRWSRLTGTATFAGLFAVCVAVAIAASWTTIARIRALRNRGDVHEATRALPDFRAAFSDADARLPADLREWANTLR